MNFRNTDLRFLCKCNILSRRRILNPDVLLLTVLPEKLILNLFRLRNQRVDENRKSYKKAVEAKSRATVNRTESLSILSPCLLYLFLKHFLTDSIFHMEKVCLENKIVSIIYQQSSRKLRGSTKSGKVKSDSGKGKWRCGER